MADNKQYVTQVQDNGTILISEDVIVSIIAHAVTEVEGVVGLSIKPGADIAEILGKKTWAKGMKIVIGEKDELYIDCNITVAYGQSVVNVAKAAQEAIAKALEDMAGVSVAEINVNVCGIVRQ